MRMLTSSSVRSGFTRTGAVLGALVGVFAFGQPAQNILNLTLLANLGQ